jgi:hypothetical protein
MISAFINSLRKSTQRPLLGIAIAFLQNRNWLKNTDRRNPFVVVLSSDMFGLHELALLLFRSGANTTPKTNPMLAPSAIPNAMPILGIMIPRAVPAPHPIASPIASPSVASFLDSDSLSVVVFVPQSLISQTSFIRLAMTFPQNQKLSIKNGSGFYLCCSLFLVSL